VNNQEKSLLRAIVSDEEAPSVRRLNALDRLCSSAGLYQTLRHNTTEGNSPATREKRFAITSLRKLLRTKQYIGGNTRASIRDRLLVIKTGESLGDNIGRKYIWINPPDQTERQPLPEQESSTVRDIEEFLTRYREEKKNANISPA